MSKQKRKEKKVKDRERRSRDKVLARRKAMREQARLEKKEFLLEKKYREKLLPIQSDEKRDQELRKRLEHNLKILEALEEEYLKEQEQRSACNTALEAEGHETMKEKLDALGDKADGNIPKEKKGFSFGGSAEVVVTPKNSK